MNVSAKRRNIAALIALGTLVVLSIVAYMTVELSFDNERLLRFAMKLRTCRAPDYSLIFRISYCNSRSSVLIDYGGSIGHANMDYLDKAAVCLWRRRDHGAGPPGRPFSFGL